MPEIQLRDFLIEVKNQIKESEDIINPVQGIYERLAPSTSEAREQYFYTQEVEVEIALTSDRSTDAGVDLYVVKGGRKVKEQNVHRVKIKMIKQGHKFPDELVNEVHRIQDANRIEEK